MVYSRVLTVQAESFYGGLGTRKLNLKELRSIDFIDFGWALLTSVTSWLEQHTRNSTHSTHTCQALAEILHPHEFYYNRIIDQTVVISVGF